MPSAALKPEPAESPEVQDPLVKLSQTIEKKIRNLEKRKTKLENYQQDLDDGKELNEDQLKAVEAYEGVVASLEMCKEFSLQIDATITDNSKYHILQKRKFQEDQAQNEIERVKHILKVQHVLGQVSHKKVREDFVSGKNGALKISNEKFNHLQEVHRILTPALSAEPTDTLNSSKIRNLIGDSAQHLVSLIDGKNKPIREGVTYKEIRSLIGQVSQCSYPKDVSSSKVPNGTSPTPSKDSVGKKAKNKTKNAPAKSQTSPDSAVKSHQQAQKSVGVPNGAVLSDSIPKNVPAAQTVKNASSPQQTLKSVPSNRSQPSNQPVKQASQTQPVKQAPPTHQPIKQAPPTHQPIKQAPPAHQSVKQAPPVHQSVKEVPQTHQPIKQVPSSHQAMEQVVPPQHHAVPSQQPIKHPEPKQSKRTVSEPQSQGFSMEGPPPGIASVQPSQDKYDVGVSQNPPPHQTAYYNSSINRSAVTVGGRGAVDLADLMGGMGSFNFLQESQVGNAGGEAAVYVDPAVVSFGSVKSPESLMQQRLPTTPPVNQAAHSNHSQVPVSVAYGSRHQHAHNVPPPTQEPPHQPPAHNTQHLTHNGPMTTQPPPASFRQPSPQRVRQPSPPRVLRQPSPQRVLRQPSPPRVLRQPSPQRIQPEKQPEPRRAPSPVKQHVSSDWAAQDETDGWGPPTEGISTWDSFVAQKAENASSEQGGSFNSSDMDYRRSGNARNNGRGGSGFGRGNFGNSGYRGGNRTTGYNQFQSNGGGSRGNFSGGNNNFRARGNGYRGGNRGNFSRGGRGEGFSRGGNFGSRGSRGTTSFQNSSMPRNSYQ